MNDGFDLEIRVVFQKYVLTFQCYGTQGWKIRYQMLRPKQMEIFARYDDFECLISKRLISKHAYEIPVVTSI